MTSLWQVVSEDPLAVNYFKKFRSRYYAPVEGDYVILPQDIIRNIPAPELKLIGTRIYYAFEWSNLDAVLFAWYSFYFNMI